MGRSRKTDKHLPKRMYLKSGGYYFVDCLNKWHNLGRIYSKAMAEYGQLTGPDSICKTISELLDRYLLEVAPLKAESSYKANISASKYIRAALGGIHIEQLTPQLIYQYTNARKKTPVSANRELALLSHMYKYAIFWGYTKTNPCIKLMRYKETPRDRYIENWEYMAFREFAGPLVGTYMDFKLLTGLRKCDILRIKLNHIQDDGIHIHISKSKKAILIEWSDLLREAVRNIRKLGRPVKGMYLFTTRKGQPYSDSGFSSIWQRKMRKAIKEGIINERFRDHDIRAKTGSDSKNLQQASELLGHADKKITERHYRRREQKVSPLG